MWILSGNERSPDVTHYLLCNRDILVGRRTDIRLEDDKSISRTHACIHITYRPEDVLSPSARGQVKLSDRSKYGTSVNGQQLEGDCTVPDGAVITFGLQWNTWTLSWRPLAVATSLLSHPERDSLKEVLAELGGTLLTDWGPTVNYLVMSSFKMSVKAVLALASGTPVVTPQFLREKAVCVRSGVAPNVDPDGFQPALDEPTLIGSSCNIGVVKERSTLFFGKRFVFAEEAQLQRMKQAIELAGGSALLLDSCNLTHSEMAERDVIVIHTELKSPHINKLKAVLKRARRRLVKDQEIGLAILRTSTERDCNPAFDYRTSFVPPLASTQSQSIMGTVLAKETQTAEQATDGSGGSLTQAPAATGDQGARRVVSPTPATPSGVTNPSAPPASSAGVVPSTPATPSGVTNPSAPPASSAGVVPPTPVTPSGAVTPSAGVVPPTPVTPRPAAGRDGRRSPPQPAASEPVRGTRGRPADPDWPAGPDEKRPRRDPPFVSSATVDAVVGPVPPSLELLSGPTVTGRRPRGSPAEESQPVCKRPRLSERARSRPTPTGGEDDFDFDLELGGRPAPPPQPKVKREPSPIPETPPSREPQPKPEPPSGRRQRSRPVKSEPEPEPEIWISSCRQANPPSPPPERIEPKFKREKVSISEDGDTSGLIHSCIRLQISALVCPRRPGPQRDATAAADDTAADIPNFKRFRRVRQPPVCPRIIGGSDLFAGHKRTSIFTNGNGPAPPDQDEEDDLRLETRRQEEDDESLFRLLDGVGRGRGSRSRRR